MNSVLQRYQRDLAEEQAEKFRLQSKLDRQSELEKILQERNFEIERLANAIATIEIEYGRFRRGLSEQEAIALGLQKDLEVANSLRSQVEHSKQAVLETNQRLRNEVQVLSAERDALRNELNHLNAEFGTTKHRLQQYVGEVRDLERMLSQKTTERSMILSDEFHTNTATSSMLLRDEEITRLRTENTMLVEQQSVLNNKIEDVQQLLTQIQAAIEQSHAEREHLIVEKRVLAAELDDKKADLTNAETTIETLNAKLDHLKSQIL